MLVPCPADELGHRVDRHVGPMLERAEDHRRDRVVDDERDAVPMGRVAMALEIVHVGSSGCRSTRCRAAGSYRRSPFSKFFGPTNRRIGPRCPTSAACSGTVVRAAVEVAGRKPGLPGLRDVSTASVMAACAGHRQRPPHAAVQGGQPPSERVLRRFMIRVLDVAENPQGRQVAPRARRLNTCWCLIDPGTRGDRVSASACARRAGERAYFGLLRDVTDQAIGFSLAKRDAVAGLANHPSQPSPCQARLRRWHSRPRLWNSLCVHSHPRLVIGQPVGETV